MKKQDLKIGPYGQGIGGPVEVVADPNNPSFDSAISTDRDARIAKIIESPLLTDWERNFLASLYGMNRMSRKQRAVFIRLSMKVKNDTSV